MKKITYNKTIEDEKPTKNINVIMCKILITGLFILAFSVNDASTQTFSDTDIHLSPSELEAIFMSKCCSHLAGEYRRPSDVYIPLSSESDLDQFSIYRSDYVSFVNDQQLGRDVQRVDVPEGQHYGMAMEYEFDGAEEVLMRWKQYLPEHWSPEAGTHIKFPGIGNRDRHGWGGRQTDGTGGWSVRTGLRSRPEQDDAVTVEFYVYHMDMGTWGTLYQWDTDERGAVLYRGEWAEMEVYVKVNTPGEADGIIKGSVNGEQRFEKTDLRFREKGYDQYDIREIIWHIYHGGASTSPVDQHIHFSDLEIWLGDVSSE